MAVLAVKKTSGMAAANCVVPAAGDGHGELVVDGGQLAVAAAPAEAVDAVADGEALGLGAHADHLAGQFEAEDGRGAVLGRVVAPALHGVGAVEGAGVHADEEVGGAGGGVGHVGQGQLLGPAGLPDDDGFHGRPSWVVGG